MQQVNLFLDEFKKIELPYSASVIALLLGYVFVIGLAVTAGLYVLTMQERTMEKEVAEQSVFWKEKYDVAFQQNPEPKISDILLRSIEGYENQISRNEDVLNYLSDRRDLIDKRTFSVYLEALTKIKQENLWLTKVLIKKGGTSLSLYGRVLDPSDLPAYLKKISDLDVFKSMQFEIFDLKRNGDQMKFVVSSEKQEKSIEDYLEQATSKN
ncbi:MAG: hypothetical protein ACI8SR_002258 [Oceanicoccus sp.]|jgi:hypothetical protein